MEFGEMKRNTSNWSNFASFWVAWVSQQQLGFLVFKHNRLHQWMYCYSTLLLL